MGVQIETDGYNKHKVVVPIVAMKAGTDFQTYVDLLVPSPAKISLLEGEGPIHLVGIHCVEELDLGEADEGEEEEEAEDVAEKEAEELVKDSANQTPIQEKLLVTDTEVEEDSAKKASSEKFVEEVSANGAGDGKLERKDSGDKKRKASQEQGEGSQGEKKVKESPGM